MKKTLLTLFSMFTILNFTVNVSLVAQEKLNGDIPSEVQDWLNGELDKAKVKELIDLDSKDFFRKEPARVIGYIKGYDRSMGFSTGIVHAGSELTREDYPRVIEVHEDGRFEVTIPLDHPVYTYLSLSKALPSFYIEPGQTLAIIFDKNNISSRRMKEGIVFMGPLAQINKELLYLETVVPEIPSRHIYSEESMKLEPDDFIQLINETVTESLSATKFYLEQEEFTPHTKTIADINSILKIPTLLLEYQSNYSYYRNDREAEVPIEFYRFLEDLPLNNHKFLMSSDFSTFINRFEYCTPFDASFRIGYLEPQKSITEYLFEELNLQPSDDDKIFMEEFAGIDSKVNNESITEEEKEKVISDFRKISDAFHDRYKKQFAEYEIKYIAPLKIDQSPVNTSIKRWTIKDSIYTNILKLQPSFVYEIAKVRSLGHSFESVLDTKEEGRAFLTTLEQGITHPYLKQEAERLLNKYYPENGAAGYIMPEDEKGTEIMKKIIDPFKGKMLFVDFWGIFCGPCVAGIKDRKETRAKYKGNSDFDFIFITSDGESPLDRYNTFVEEQELEHTYRLTDDEYLYLRQLFKFNGISRYILIGKDGTILNDNFNMYSFEHELTVLFGNK